MYDSTIVCVHADQNAPAPKGLYASIRVLHHMEHLASPYKKQTTTDEGITTEYYKQMRYRLNVNFYRNGALEACEFMLGAHRLESIAALMLKHDIGWGGTTSVRNLSALQSTELEERANIEINLFLTKNIVDKTDYIDSSKFTFDPLKN